MPKFYDQLSEASLENLASDPSNLPEGRIWLNTTSGLVKQVIGGVIKVVATADNTITFANKTISGAANTINNVPAANIVNTPSGNLTATDVQGALNELQSDVDTRALSSALTTHTSATTSVHGIADTADLLTTSNAKVVTGKDIDGGTASNTSRITIPKDTLANLQALTRKAGTVVFATDTGKQYIDNGTNLVPVGTGAGGKNYLPDGDAEGPNPWSTYADGAATPVDGTGGSPTLTITQSSTAPLADQKSFVVTSGALGDGASYPFTIDSIDKLSLQTLVFSTDGAFAAGDISLWCYDVTNGVLIAPQASQFPSNVAGKQSFIFQLGTGTSYRFLLHQATSNSFTAKFEVSLSAMPFAGYAPIQTNWTAYTPTFTGFGTTTNVEFFSRRNGSDLEIKGKFTCGTPTATEARISIGSAGVDSNVLSDPTIIPTIRNVGVWAAGAGAVSALYNKTVLVESGVSYLTFGLGATIELTKVTGTSLLVASSEMSLFASIPIQGWSSESKVVSEYDGRVVAAQAYVSSNYSTSSNDYVNFNTIVKDSHSGITTGTGTSWKYTVKVSGTYRVSTVLSLTSGTINFQLYKNGSAYAFMTQANTGIQSGEVILDLVAGDELSILSVLGASIAGGTPMLSYININMLSGAQQILTGHNIYADYYVSSNQSVGFGTKIDFDSKISDTSGSLVTTGSGWKFTAPAKGIYLITGCITCTAVSGYLDLLKNNSPIKTLSVSASGSNYPESFSSMIELNYSDYIHLEVDAANTVVGGTNAAGAYWSHIQIKQVN